MDKFLKIVGAVVVIWIGISLVLWLIGKTIGLLFWVAVIGGAIWAVAAISNKRTTPGGYTRGPGAAGVAPAARRAGRPVGRAEAGGCWSAARRIRLSRSPAGAGSRRWRSVTSGSG